MIPIRDTTRSKNYPVVNNALIGVNVLFFVLELLQGPRMNQFIFTYGLSVTVQQATIPPDPGSVEPIRVL